MGTPQIGINTFVWASPLTTADFETIAPRVGQMGFDSIELPIEGETDLDYSRCAAIPVMPASPSVSAR